MNSLKPFIQTYSFGDHQIQLWVPQEDAVVNWYQQGAQNVFPFWSRVWPAAIGLCRFIQAHPEWVAGKQVLEIASGLGLPSLLAASFAAQVITTDVSSAAIEFVNKSAAQNALINVEGRVLDWKHIPGDIKPEVVLLSDVNYDPKTFGPLMQMLMRFLQEGAAVLLSTPQRLMAKPFVDQLIPYCCLHQTESVLVEKESTDVSVLVLSCKRMN